MPQEVLKKPTQLFPSFREWFKLVNTQEPKQRVIDRPEHVTLKYITSKGVTNSIEFYDRGHNLSLSANYLPSRLSQTYINKEKKFQIEAHLNDGYLSNQLDITPNTNLLTHVTISSESYLGNEHNDRQGVFMSLDDAYLGQLKTQNLVLADSRSRVWIRTTDEGEIKATIEGQGNDELPLDYAALKRICDDANFDFQIHVKDHFTKGAIGGIRFKLDHTRLTVLDEHKILRVLTGTSREKFIFPVHVR